MVLSCRKVQFAQTVINERQLLSHRAIAVGGSYRSFGSKCLVVFVRQLPHFQSAGSPRASIRCKKEPLFRSCASPSISQDQTTAPGCGALCVPNDRYPRPISNSRVISCTTPSELRSALGR